MKQISKLFVTKLPVMHKMASGWDAIMFLLLRDKDKFVFLLCLCFLTSLCPCFCLQAQTLNGTVSDAETRRPLEAAMISVLRGNTMIDYALTDAQGHYSLPWKYNGTLQVCISMLGYRREMRKVSATGVLNIFLQFESIVLKEVEIRPGRISSRKDTVRYNLADFASSKDVHIKDVLKKLPGMDVEENGQVKYKGKAIDHFLVEGMDVTGGRYNQINNNLNAKAVKSAEIMENYQSVKALKGKINSEKVALNLQLDPAARDQWIVNATLGNGWSNASQEIGNIEKRTSEKGELLWDATANALQLGKGKQSVYSYKTNNNGTDLSREQALLTNNSSEEIPLPHFLAQSATSAPLDLTRLLFNETHTLNANRMCQWNDERSLRLQAGYTHNQISQQRRNMQIYYQPDDTLHIDETYHYHLLSDAAHLEAHYEDNRARHFLANRFLVEGETNRGTSRELQQTIRTSQLAVKNLFSFIRNEENSTWEFNSVTQYAYIPSMLSLASEKNKYGQQNLYTDNKGSCLKKHNGFTRRYTVGVQGEWGKVQHTKDMFAVSLYVSPYFELGRGKWLTSLSLPLKSSRYFAQQKSFLFFDPVLYLRYQLDYHWRFSLYGSLSHVTGDITDLYPFMYRTDYRTWKNGKGLFPVSTRQLYNLYGEYKNTAQEFFITATLAYQRAHNNTLNEQCLSEDAIVYTRRKLNNHTDNWSLQSTLSKGFFDWNLKTSINLLLSRSAGRQLTKIQNTAAPFFKAEVYGKVLLQTYRYDYLQVEPTLIWSPAELFDAEYHATIGYGGSKIGNDTHLSPLLNLVQRLHVTFSIGRADLRLSGEYYRNDLGAGAHLNTVFADAALLYKVKKWRLEARMNNLFNKKEYAYTQYSATQTYTSRLNIRPREMMVLVSYQF
ncbi:MAG: carboxypeptidase-like regulatory domain-containing protein [Bacteroides sp.]